jgi:hypothetical protein
VQPGAHAGGNAARLGARDGDGVCTSTHQLVLGVSTVQTAGHNGAAVSAEAFEYNVVLACCFWLRHVIAALGETGEEIGQR